MSYEIQELNARIRELEESNAWFRARNMELLRLLSGRKDHPGDKDPHVQPQAECPHCRCHQPSDHLKCDDCGADMPLYTAACEVAANLRSGAPAPFVRNGHAHL